jgi:hypothetical protein
MVVADAVLANMTLLMDQAFPGQDLGPGVDVDFPTYEFFRTIDFFFDDWTLCVS